MPYNKWDDAEFVAEMDRRVKALESGTDKGFTWEEVKERARQAVKAEKENDLHFFHFSYQPKP